MALGNLIIIAAPSGTGKTSLVKELTDVMNAVTVSISHTTRPKRPAEVDGRNYYFVDKKTFEDMIEKNEFLEYATVFENLYGTSRKWVDETLKKGLDVILEIDWQGAKQIKDLLPESISIFILPPSLAHLAERLGKRNQDHPDVVKKRLADARETISHIQDFDYIIVNDDFGAAVNELKTIILASRLSLRNQLRKLVDLIRMLKEDNYQS